MEIHDDINLELTSLIIDKDKSTGAGFFIARNAEQLTDLMLLANAWSFEEAAIVSSREFQHAQSVFAVYTPRMSADCLVELNFCRFVPDDEELIMQFQCAGGPEETGPMQQRLLLVQLPYVMPLGLGVDDDAEATLFLDPSDEHCDEAMVVRLPRIMLPETIRPVRNNDYLTNILKRSPGLGSKDK